MPNQRTSQEQPVNWNPEDFVLAYRLLVQSCIVAARATIPDFAQFRDLVWACAAETSALAAELPESSEEKQLEVLRTAEEAWRGLCSQLS